MAASLSTRQHLLAVGLTANAGFVDGLFFIHLGGYFVSFMSGNSTRAAAELSQGNYLAWVAASSLIVAFIIGVMLSSFAVRFGPKRFHPSAESLLTDQVTPHGSAVWVAYALMLLGGITAVIPAVDRVAPFIVAAATGAINGTFTRRGEVTVGLTYMTGTLVKMGQALASAIALRSSVYLFLAIPAAVGCDCHWIADRWLELSAVWYSRHLAYRRRYDLLEHHFDLASAPSEGVDNEKA